MNEDWKIHLCKSGIYPATVDDIGETLAAAGYAVVKTDPIQDQVIRALAAVGWAVVPVEPTEAQVAAAEALGIATYREVYRAMIAKSSGLDPGEQDIGPLENPSAQERADDRLD